MIVGNCSKFAVEFELDKKYGGTWLYGKICYWIQNKRIGDYELGTSLRDVLFQMRSIIGDRANRFHQELFELDAVHLYERLNNALFGYEDSQYSKISIEETWARFNVTIPVDVFDECKIFLLESKELSRFIIKDVKAANVYEVLLKDSQFDRVMAEAYNELNRLYDLEVENDS